jgi:protoheme IX farnesyltransferase
MPTAATNAGPGPPALGGAASASGAAAGLARARAFAQLTKPGITRLVVATGAAGYYLGTRGGFDFILFLHTLIGMALAASGSNALNQFAEREVDARMKRTAWRPLPSGRLRPPEALVFGLAIGALGILQLFLFVNLTTALLVAASLGSYVLVYTPLKRLTWWCTLVGALPGALPILAGWTAAGRAVDASGLALFGILFLWQMPHFFALAWMYREDYMRGGLRMLTAYDPTGQRTARQIVLYCVALVAVSLLPSAFGTTGWIYAAGAAISGLAFLLLGATLALDRTEHRARRVFIGSVVYLPVLLGLMIVDKAG